MPMLAHADLLVRVFSHGNDTVRSSHYGDTVHVTKIL